MEDKIQEADPDFHLLLLKKEQGGKENTAEDYQMRLWADRYRGAEIVFQPCIVGFDCQGLTEIIEQILH